MCRWWCLTAWTITDLKCILNIPDAYQFVKMYKNIIQLNNFRKSAFITKRYVERVLSHLHRGILTCLISLSQCLYLTGTKPYFIFLEKIVSKCTTTMEHPMRPSRIISLVTRNIVILKTLPVTAEHFLSSPEHPHTQFSYRKMYFAPHSFQACNNIWFFSA